MTRATRQLRLVAPTHSAGGSRTETECNYPDADAAALRTTHKRIVICADGTWNTPFRSPSGPPQPTNVWLTYQLVTPASTDGTPQLAYYHTGIGTVGGPIGRMLGGLGIGIRHTIVDCYRFLVEHYNPGDDLYLFGFSRGAYTVRSLAGLVRNAGIIDANAHPDAADRDTLIDEAWHLYRGRGEDTSPVAQRAVDFRVRYSCSDFRIRCIGVWDTVGALGIPVGGIVGWLSRYFHGFHDVTLSSQVDRAFHAIAVDERRGPYLPTLWVQQPDAPRQGQVLEQVWFPGVHSDIGGDEPWPERGLATTALRWLIDRVTATCGLELDVAMLDAAPPSAIAQHDSLSWYYRLPPLTNPVVRIIDGGLGQYGSRGTSRASTESMHDTVLQLARQYADRPMPAINRPYNPPNVLEYILRVHRSKSYVAPAPSPFPPDIRPFTPDLDESPLLDPETVINALEAEQRLPTAVAAADQEMHAHAWFPVVLIAGFVTLCALLLVYSVLL